MTICYLIWSRAWDYNEAFDYVRGRRGVARPNVGFMCQLIQWAQQRQALRQQLAAATRASSSLVVATTVHEILPQFALWRRHVLRRQQRAANEEQPDLRMRVEEVEQHLLPVLCTRSGDWTDGQVAVPSSALLHSRGCFVVSTATGGKRGKPTVFVWVGEGVGGGTGRAGGGGGREGEAAPGLARETVVRAASRQARNMVRCGFVFGDTAKPALSSAPGAEGSADDGGVVVEQGSEPDAFWQALDSGGRGGAGGAAGAKPAIATSPTNGRLAESLREQAWELDDFYSGEVVAGVVGWLSGDPSYRGHGSGGDNDDDDDESGAWEQKLDLAARRGHGRDESGRILARLERNDDDVKVATFNNALPELYQVGRRLSLPNVFIVCVVPGCAAAPACIALTDEQPVRVHPFCLCVRSTWAVDSVGMRSVSTKRMTSCRTASFFCSTAGTLVGQAEGAHAPHAPGLSCGSGPNMEYKASKRRRRWLERPSTRDPSNPRLTQTSSEVRRISCACALVCPHAARLFARGPGRGLCLVLRVYTSNMLFSSACATLFTPSWFLVPGCHLPHTHSGRYIDDLRSQGRGRDRRVLERV